MAENGMQDCVDRVHVFHRCEVRRRRKDGKAFLLVLFAQ
jgi:hypothetical protein